MGQEALWRTLWLTVGVSAMVGGLGRAARADAERVRVHVVVSSMYCDLTKNFTWPFYGAMDIDHFVTTSDTAQETFSDVDLPPPTFFTWESQSIRFGISDRQTLPYPGNYYTAFDAEMTAGTEWLLTMALY